MEIGTIEMKGTLFSPDNCKSNTTGEGERAEVGGNELSIDSIPNLEDEIKVESSIKTKLLIRSPPELVSAKELDKEGA
ncbi:hypothetical protein RIR_jg42453.t1 [Rhizophagus irregularis DAOM 181602=DAOM 197198]|nr:hypothetical protein RIR_jg42453.t1 [Rhizophagus irregularis DAOM 181602=DAOM 197198]